MPASSAKPAFRFEECVKPDWKLVVRVLSGEMVGVIIRSYMPEPACRAAMQAFVNNPSTRRRDGDAHGTYLGAYHWQKSLERYSAECAEVRDSVDEVAGARTGGAWNAFVDEVRSEIAHRGHSIRNAVCMGTEVVSPLIRSWTGDATYSLIPHDDGAQCTDPRQLGFEIQGVGEHAVCSANLCIANAGGGELVMWNYAPTTRDRIRFGTDSTGGPYPPAELSQYERIEIPVRSGDLYVFNGSFVHAVNATRGERATMAMLFGYKSDHEIVMWS